MHIWRNFYHISCLVKCYKITDTHYRVMITHQENLSLNIYWENADVCI